MKHFASAVSFEYHLIFKPLVSSVPTFWNVLLLSNLKGANVFHEIVKLPAFSGIGAVLSCWYCVRCLQCPCMVNGWSLRSGWGADTGLCKIKLVSGTKHLTPASNSKDIFSDKTTKKNQNQTHTTFTVNPDKDKRKRIDGWEVFYIFFLKVCDPIKVQYSWLTFMVSCQDDICEELNRKILY